MGRYSIVPPLRDFGEANVRFGSKADIGACPGDVCFTPFVPKADIVRCGERHRYSITSSARASSDCGTVSPSALAVLRLMVNSYRRLHREIARLLALENAIDIAGRAPVKVNVIRSVGDQATIRDADAVVIDGRQLIAGDEF